MSSRWKTSRLSEALEASDVVVELARDVLSLSEFEVADIITRNLLGTKKSREEARQKLKQLLSPPPKRPLYYYQHEIQFLPRWTRDAIRYLGDYVDLLVKAMTFELTGDTNSKKNSLGKNVRLLETKKRDVLTRLIDRLRRYNSFLYTPGKHDFRVPKRRGHRFTSREVVLTAFITMKLADEIKSISEFAKKVSGGKVDLEDL